MNNKKSSFAPLVEHDSEILILGSLPGEVSLAAVEYYAHPRNRFWKMLATVFAEPQPQDYDEKKSLLRRHRVALWDMAKTAFREGSLDSDMSDVIVNEVDKLIDKHPTIKTVCFNGQKASLLFRQHFTEKEGIVYHTLPSTSPANASYSFERICNEWGKYLKPSMLQ
ncbi:MAG: DNA-deoxyinosine glycosylase [Dysgonamonadaceae bacterium]|nr:DNA-deoxyinosine glycosylase [Dysgonamonadaceae bacterium]